MRSAKREAIEAPPPPATSTRTAMTMTSWAGRTKLPDGRIRNTPNSRLSHSEEINSGPQHGQTGERRLGPAIGSHQETKRRQHARVVLVVLLGPLSYCNKAELRWRARQEEACAGGALGAHLSDSVWWWVCVLLVQCAMFTLSVCALSESLAGWSEFYF